MGTDQTHLNSQLSLFQTKQKYYQYCLEQMTQDPKRKASVNPNSMFNRKQNDPTFLAKYVPLKADKLQ